MQFNKINTISQKIGKHEGKNMLNINLNEIENTTMSKSK